VPDAALWITEDDVADLLTLPEAIEVLAGTYLLQAGGQAASMRRAHTRSGDAILHAVGGIIAGAGLTGTKTWTYTPGGAAPLLILFSLTDGSVLGIVEAFALGQMRTAATAGLGTRLLAAPQAETLALLGTGKQAFAQAAAVAAVRPIRRISLFGRDTGRRGALAQRLGDELSVAVTEHDDVAEAVHGTEIVTTITRAADPVLTGPMLAPGMHVNAVGAIVPSRRELDENAIARCHVIVVDSLEQARDDAGELRAAAAAGQLDWELVRGLDGVVQSATGALRGPGDITLMKTLGVGLSDVALGAEILRRAQAADAGRPLPRPALSHH
jgi:ornithine cyclodeaminase